MSFPLPIANIMERIITLPISANAKYQGEHLTYRYQFSVTHKHTEITINFNSSNLPLYRKCPCLSSAERWLLSFPFNYPNFSYGDHYGDLSYVLHYHFDLLRIRLPDLTANYLICLVFAKSSSLNLSGPRRKTAFSMVDT